AAPSAGRAATRRVVPATARSTIARPTAAERAARKAKARRAIARATAVRDPATAAAPAAPGGARLFARSIRLRAAHVPLYLRRHHASDKSVRCRLAASGGQRRISTGLSRGARGPAGPLEGELSKLSSLSRRRLRVHGELDRRSRLQLLLPSRVSAGL